MDTILFYTVSLRRLHCVEFLLREADAPIVFKEIGYVNQNSTLFASGVILIIKLAAVILFLLGPVEYFGRRSLLMTGTLYVVCMHAII